MVHIPCFVILEILGFLIPVGIVKILLLVLVVIASLRLTLT